MSGRSRLSCIRDLGQTRCIAIIQHKRVNNCAVDSYLGCWLFTGSKNTDGYGQTFEKKNSDWNKTGRSAQTAFTLHNIAFTASHGRDAIHHVSHICNQRHCFNPEHLQDETPVINNSRKNCPGPLFCSVHGHLVVDLCQHRPACLRTPRSDVYCCLAIRESDPGWVWQTPVEHCQTSGELDTGQNSQTLPQSSDDLEDGGSLEQAIRDDQF